MIVLALQVVALAWCLQWLDPRFLPATAAWPWLLLASAALLPFGRRAALLAAVASWTLLQAAMVQESRLPEAAGQVDVDLAGVICDFPRTDPETTRFVFDVTGAPAGFAPRRLYLSWYDGAPALRPGDRWALRVRVKPPRGSSNPGGSDFEHWLYTRGIGAVGYVRDAQPLAPLLSLCPVGRARAGLADRIEAALAGRAGASLVLGVVAGATHRITEQEWALLRETGTTHLVAISGLNIAMVVAPVMLAGPWLATWLPAGAGVLRLSRVAAVVLAVGYCALAGFAVSTVRAVLMLVLVLLLAARRRAADICDVLAIVAIVTVLGDPAQVSGASFWLSFVAVAWLVVLCLATPAEGPWTVLAMRQARDLLRAQAVLGLGLAPLALAWFGSVSLVAPATNLVAVPAFTLLVMPLALLGAALLWVLPSAGGALLSAAAWVVDTLLGALELSTALFPPTWSPALTGPIAVALTVPLAFGLAWPRPVPGRLLVLACLAPLLTGIDRTRPDLRVVALDVGQGLSVLVETRRHAVLYDAGPRFRATDAGESVIVPALRRLGWRGVDTVVISHEDADHRGGLDSLLEALPVRRLLAPAPMAARLPALPCRRGVKWRYDGVTFEVLSPERAGEWSSDNDGSCVLLVRAGVATVLLPGDIERPREDWLQRQGLLPTASLVLAPHHGSTSSSGESFVTATRPRHVVFSAGYLNRWRFPRPEVVARWEGTGACAVDTAGSGAITFGLAADGRLLLLERHRASHARPWTAPAAPTRCEVAAERAPAGVNSRRTDG